MSELSKSLVETLYPDLIAAGGLHVAVSRAFAAIGSPLTATTISGFIPYAQVQHGSRFSQIYVAAQERLFIFDLWLEGVAYANGSGKNIEEMAQAIQEWLLEEPSVNEMKQRFSFVTFTGKGEAHEAGTLVEQQWQELLKRWEDSDKQYGGVLSPTPLIRGAMLRPELRQLYPYTSLYRLRFSRTTGFPFTNDCPYAEPLGNGLYRASLPAYGVAQMREPETVSQEAVDEVLGEGTVEEVLDLLIAHLPPDCGPAVNGTAVDFAG
jgi:hypothetical protein